MLTANDTVRALRRLQRRLRNTESTSPPIYVQGSFVPTLVGATTPGTFTYTANASLVEWTRIGNRLFFNGRLSIGTITVAPVGTITINGWPYAGVADTNMAIAGGAAILLWRTNIATAHTQLAGQFANGASAMNIILSGDNIAPVVMSGADIALVGGVLEFRFEGSYRVG